MKNKVGAQMENFSFYKKAELSIKLRPDCTETYSKWT